MLVDGHRGLSDYRGSLTGGGSSPHSAHFGADGGTYASGATRLIADVDPPSLAPDVTQVTFFADGHQIFVVPKPPFQCDWDAGEKLVEHQIRIVASLKSGDRLVATVRTQGLQYSEGVDVDVVLYEARSARRSIRSADEDRAMFLKYAAYDAVPRPQRAVVDQWKKFMSR